MRPTTKDLAKAAGVSLATIDRVLNGRAGVKERTILKVNETIEEIGFERNMQAANLARGKDYRFQFILPLVGGRFLIELISRIEEANARFSSERVFAEVKQLDSNDPHLIANYLASLDKHTIDGVAIMVPDSPQVRDAIARLAERGMEVVQFLSGEPKERGLDFVGIDNNAAGATAGHLIGRFIGPSSGKIMVISDTIQSRGSIERRLGFDQIMADRFPALNPLPSLETYGNAARTNRIVQQAFENNADIVGVYIMNSEAELPLSAIQNARVSRDLVVVAHERTTYTEQALGADHLDAIISQNTGHAVRSAIRTMRARCENREPFASQEKLRIEILLKHNL